eukprot:CAMPEP_0174249898 /NCGR_PEP_ID=MMETSP0439-20130205/231_1 /TAXON_ID=0 /ORGANISM="Stereomyxa ramosa, Strain Chinc5" /LENGTH=433 /DNA_ID=CAMNT_0015329833 /DNA_START=625 /DNA_END=1926 /DNA_ORIENTATION=+
MEYLPYVIITGLFFLIPAVQVADNYVRNRYDEGQRDSCYFNELCMKPTFYFPDAGKIWSNLGYGWSGIILTLYMLLIRHTLKFKFLVARNSFVLYAIGVAICFEGALSAIYHFCPNRSNFQFDTAFMFVISGLMMVELYRKYFHSHYRPFIPFSIFALLLGLNYAASYIDVLSNDNDRELARYVFRAVLSVISVVAMLFLIYSFYLKPKKKVINLYELEKNFSERLKLGFPERVKQLVHRPYHIFRALVLIAWFIMSQTLIWVSANSDLSTTILYIMVGSLLVFFVAYLFHKIRRFAILVRKFHQFRALGEASIKKEAKHSWVVFLLWIYLSVGTLACWTVALVYFKFYSTTNKNLTPEQSRNINTDCLFFDFWDAHDAWHLASSVALFWGSLFLIHMDINDKVPLVKYFPSERSSLLPSPQSSTNDDLFQEN